MYIIVSMYVVFLLKVGILNSHINVFQSCNHCYFLFNGGEGALAVYDKKRGYYVNIFICPTSGLYCIIADRSLFL